MIPYLTPHFPLVLSPIAAGLALYALTGWWRWLKESPGECLGVTGWLGLWAWFALS